MFQRIDQLREHWMAVHRADWLRSLEERAVGGWLTVDGEAVVLRVGLAVTMRVGPAPALAAKPRPDGRRLAPEDLEAMDRALKAGMTHQEVADRLGVARTTVTMAAGRLRRAAEAAGGAA